MKNKLMDLNNHLFAELERLGDEELKGEELKEEESRAKAIANISRSIIDNARLALDAKRFEEELGTGQNLLPELLQ